MRKKRRIETTIETHRVLIVRRPGQAVSAWCAWCDKEVRMTTPEWAAIQSSTSTRTIYRWIEAGTIHFTETPEGGLLICLNSLEQSPFGPQEPVR